MSRMKQQQLVSKIKQIEVNKGPRKGDGRNLVGQEKTVTEQAQFLSTEDSYPPLFPKLVRVKFREWGTQDEKIMLKYCCTYYSTQCDCSLPSP